MKGIVVYFFLTCLAILGVQNRIVAQPVHLAASISGVEPDIIPADNRSHEIAITGVGFSSDVKILVDHFSVPFRLIDSSHLVMEQTFSQTEKHTLEADNGDYSESQSWLPGLLSVKERQITTSISKASTAGGTRLSLFGIDCFEADSAVFFEPGIIKNAQHYQVPAEAVVFHDSNHLEVVTPRMPTTTAMIVVHNVSKPDIYSENGVTFVPLAYVLAGNGRTIHILDAASNDIYYERPSMALDREANITDIALSKGTLADKQLYGVDARSGNLQIFDASNLQKITNVELQDGALSNWGARNVEVSANGKYAYVLHVTSGAQGLSGGAVSIVDLKTWQLVDADSNRSTPSPGAPQGVNRMELGNSFVGASIKDVYIPRSLESSQTGSKWPGEFLLISGAEVKTSSDLTPICAAKNDARSCNSIFSHSLPIDIKVIDLNPEIVNRMPNGYFFFSPNPEYRKIVKTIPTGSFGQQSGKNGLHFDLLFDESKSNAFVYAVSSNNDRVLIVDMETLDLSREPNGAPVFLPTGSQPEDLKIEEVNVRGIGKTTVAYIANAGDASITMIDVRRNTEILPALHFKGCSEQKPSISTVITKNDGQEAYVVDQGSDSLSVLDLTEPVPGPCDINSSHSAAKVIIQRILDAKEVLRQTKQNFRTAAAEEFRNETLRQSLLSKVDKLTIDHSLSTEVNDFSDSVNRSIVGKGLTKVSKRLFDFTLSSANESLIPDDVTTEASLIPCTIGSVGVDSQYSEWIRFHATMTGSCATTSDGKHFGIQYYHDGLPILGSCPKFTNQSGGTAEWVFSTLGNHTIGARVVEWLWWPSPDPGIPGYRTCPAYSSVVTKSRTFTQPSDDADADGLINSLESSLKLNKDPDFMWNPYEPLQSHATSVTVRIGPILSKLEPGPKVKVFINYNMLWSYDYGCPGGEGDHAYDTEPMFYVAEGGTTPASSSGWSIVFTETAAHDGTSFEVDDISASFIRTIFIADVKHSLYIHRCSELCNDCTQDNYLFTQFAPHNVGNTAAYPYECTHPEHLHTGNYLVPEKWTRMINHYSSSYFSPFPQE